MGYDWVKMASVLIIGGGNIAGGFDAAAQDNVPPFSHAGAYTRHGGFRLAACVEPDGDRRARFVRRWGVEQGYGSLDELPTSARFDVVSICSPTKHHAEHLEAALRFEPRVIFCEKPLTGSTEASAACAAVVERAGAILMVNYSRRWDARVICLADQLRSGTWGRVRAAAGWYNKGLLNNGSHMVDLLHFLLGQLVVTAVGAPVADMWPEDPSIPAVLRTSDGIPVTLNCGDARDYALFELQIVTERGVVAMEEGGLYWRSREANESETFKGYRVVGSGIREPGELAGAMSSAVAEISRILTVGGTARSNSVNALAAQRLCETIRERAAVMKAT